MSLDVVADLTPITECTGFKTTLGNMQIMLGYAVYPKGLVLLFAFEILNQSPPKLWRSVWTGKESAVRMAEELLDDVDEYLDSLGPIRRPSEDLDMDDFIFHIESRMNNGFH